MLTLWAPPFELPSKSVIRPSATGIQLSTTTTLCSVKLRVIYSEEYWSLRRVDRRVVKVYGWLVSEVGEAAVGSDLEAVVVSGMAGG